MLASISDQIGRDREYLETVYQVNREDASYREYLVAVAKNERLFSQLFSPLASCMLILIEHLQDKDLIQKHFSDLAYRYRRIIRKNLISAEFYGGKDDVQFSDQTRVVRGGIMQEIYDQDLDDDADPTLWESCRKDDGNENIAHHDFDRDLPYTTITLAYVLYSLGNPESGILEIERWLEKHETPDRAGWHDLLDTRAYLHMAILFSQTGRERHAQEMRKRVIGSLSRVVGIYDSYTLDRWQKTCAESSVAEQRLVLGLLNVMNDVAYTAIELKETVDGATKRHAETIEYIEKECFDEVDREPERRRAAFLHTYAMVLVRSAEQKEIIHSEDQGDFINRLLTARTALERALEQARVSGQRSGAKSKDRPLRQALLDLGDAGQLEAIIEEDLRRVKEMTRSSS
jgi:hypothetical protein